jgi:hypothetical protein
MEIDMGINITPRMVSGEPEQNDDNDRMAVEPSPDRLHVIVAALEATYGRDAVIAALSPIPETSPAVPTTAQIMRLTERQLAVSPVYGALRLKVQSLEIDGTNKRLEARAADTKPDPSTFVPIVDLWEAAKASGPVPSKKAVWDWHGKAQAEGYAETRGGKWGNVMCPKYFERRLARYRSEYLARSRRKGQPA